MKYAITLSSVCALLFAPGFHEVAEALAKTHSVHAVVAGIEVNTLVDSAVAGQLLNDNGQYLPAAVSTDLNSRVSCRSVNELPSVRSLQDITRDYSTDTATAMLIQCLSSIPSIQTSQQLFLSELAQRRANDPEQAAFLAGKANEYLILIVPGWGYQTNSAETGADLATPRQIIAGLGFENHLVEVEDTGSVESGAKILATAVQRYSHSGKKIILVSASSGGPTVALALNDPVVASNPQLVGWLNICGVLRGTPVIDRFLPWPKSLLLHTLTWYEGWNYEDLVSLSRTQSKPRYAGFVSPPQLTIVNYVGIPFSGQVSDMGQDFYSMLKTQGPNDGLTLIPDALAPGYTIMAVGMDHFINNDPEIDIKTAALVPVLLKLIEN
jgi:hypothetical protein